MQNVLIYNLEVACAGTSHLDREVRVGSFLSLLSGQNLIPSNYLPKGNKTSTNENKRVYQVHFGSSYQPQTPIAWKGIYIYYSFVTI